MAPGQMLDRRAPVCCSAVEDFVRDRHLQQHRRKVADSRTLIENKWSVREETKVQASRRNAKKEQAQDDRFAQIERENYRLLGRMHEIEKRRSPAHAAAQLALAGPTSRSGAASRSSSLPAGSKAVTKMKELKRIDEENARMLRRLQGAKSSVDLASKDAQWQRQQKVMRLRLERPNDQARHEARTANAALKERFTPLPPINPMDEEFARLLHLQEHLRGQAEGSAAEDDEEAPDAVATLKLDYEGLDEEQQAAFSGSRPSTGASGSAPSRSPQRSPGAAAMAPMSPLAYAGVIPEHSRKVVEELMAMHAEEAQRYEDEEEAAAAAKAAAEDAFRAAIAVDVTSGDDMGYGAFVRRAEPMITLVA